MAVSLADITKLRKMTGAGMMDCKNALTEAEGDIDKAIEVIRKKGQAFAAKRSDREASEGCVLAGANGGFAAIVGLKCETDFVAINADFVALAKQVLDAALENKAKSIEEVLALAVNDSTIADLITYRSGITGEKMELGFYEIVEAESTVAYIHPGNKLATIVAFNQTGVDTQVAKDVAMQVAAMNPVSLSKDDVPAHIVETELNVGREKAREEGKPENMLDKIAQGRLNKFYQDSTLLAQAFIKDAKVTVADYMNSQSKGLTATAFKRVTLNVE